MECIHTKTSNARQLIGKIRLESVLKFAALILFHHLMQKRQDLVLRNTLAATGKPNHRLSKQWAYFTVDAYQGWQTSRQMEVGGAAFNA